MLMFNLFWEESFFFRLCSGIWGYDLPSAIFWVANIFPKILLEFFDVAPWTVWFCKNKYINSEIGVPCSLSFYSYE